MTKECFLMELEAKLRYLPKDERDAALQYYEEYFQEAGPGKEQEVIAELKSPSHVASKILAEFAAKERAVKTKSQKSGWNGFLFTFLALCAAPIAFPLLLVLIILVFVVVVTLVSLAIGLVIAALGLLVGGVFALVVLPIKGILWIGSACLAIGLFILIIALLKGLFNFITNKLRGDKN